ncbi:MAG: sodium:calcium antiporter [Chloroflexi bacterium]|nr:sodium:calcium antiporter [Chloroflexota bacterium]
MSKPYHGTGPWLWVAGALLVSLLAIAIRLSGAELSAPTQSAIFGVSIVAAAFLLAWATEAAQMDVAQAFALAALALIAVLPEYAVDGFFAWRAASDPTYVHYATANMTGGNRLLIGIGWSMVVLLVWLKFRQPSVHLEKHQKVTLSFLALATAYSFLIPLKGRLGLEDSAVLVTLFGLYLWTSARAGKVQPELLGPAAALGALRTRWRRTLVLFFFGFSAAVILASAEPFADGLVHTGRQFEIDEFILVQWIAPLASEAPELTVVAIFALANKGSQALGALVSSKVNQWTLLVGTLPIIYSASLGSPGALALDSRQAEEILLTAAQSAFGLAVLASMSLSLREALALFVLFSVQLVFPDPTVRYVFVGIYLALAAALFIRQAETRAGLLDLIKAPLTGLRRGFNSHG